MHSVNTLRKQIEDQRSKIKDHIDFGPVPERVGEAVVLSVRHVRVVGEVRETLTVDESDERFGLFIAIPAAD